MIKSLVNQINGNSAEILLYGIIGKWMDIDVDYLVKDLEGLKKSGCQNLTFYVNSDGGEVPQGQALWNYLNRSEFNVTWVVDGIAASMMAMLITNPRHTVIANKYSKFMYHRLSGYVQGNHDDVRAYADMMDKFEADLVDMFANRTGIDAKKVKKDYFCNTNTWLSAQEALSLKLVNEIRDGKEITAPDTLADPRDVYNHFSQQLINYSNNNQTKSKMKKIAQLLNLDENATEDAIATAVNNILEKNRTHAAELSQKDNMITGLQNQINDFNKAKVKNLIDTGIAEKKFGEDMRETYTKMAETDYATAEKVINSLAGVGRVIDEIDKDTIPEADRKKTWDQLHKECRLENIKSTNLAWFQQLYKEKFNKEYKS